MKTKRGRRFSFDVKRRAVLMWERGWSEAEIASSLGTTTQSVRTWLQRFEDGGLDALQRRTGSSQRHTPGQIKSLVLRLRREHPEWSLNRLAAEVTPHRYPGGDRAFSPASVSRILEEMGAR